MWALVRSTATGSAMPTEETIKTQQQLLDAHRLTLAVYLQQRAVHGTLTPPHVIHGINEARTHISRIKAVLRSWGVPVEDGPLDDASMLPPSYAQHNADLPIMQAHQPRP